MRGSKKISDFFIDAKVPKAQRRMVPLVVDRDKILWIAGMRISEKVRPTSATKKILKAEII